MPRQAAKEFSDQTVESLRKSLSFVPSGAIAITFGSFARREASEQSDIDYIVVGSTPTPEADLMPRVDGAVLNIVETGPSTGGAFGEYVFRGDMLRNLGGNGDTNEALTRRMLLLLEGEWLSAEAEFHEFRRELISRYVMATPKDQQLALFLLNDIIRYWRTMTVDYMYKTTEDTKPWAIRNIKLIFSRKLMYASGLFSVGMTLHMSAEKKISTLTELFSIPAIERLEKICGKNRVAVALKCYNFFLQRIADAEVRNALSVKDLDRSDPTFRELKNEGHIFTRELLQAFDRTFDATHPIRRAIVF